MGKPLGMTDEVWGQLLVDRALGPLTSQPPMWSFWFLVAVIAFGLVCAFMEW